MTISQPSYQRSQGPLACRCYQQNTIAANRQPDVLLWATNWAFSGGFLSSFFTIAKQKAANERAPPTVRRTKDSGSVQQYIPARHTRPLLSLPLRKKNRKDSVLHSRLNTHQQKDHSTGCSRVGSEVVLNEERRIYIIVKNSK